MLFPTRKTEDNDMIHTKLCENIHINTLCEITLQLTPIIADPEYLLDQHILICVKSTDCDESYGEFA